ncbi:MAG: type II toxin-antitoxin system VapC family toxin [Chloroflexota bacterium]
MIVYADTSALVKRYVCESGTDDVIALIDNANTVGSVILANTEMASTLSKAIRQGWVEQDAARTAWQDFLGHWPSFTRLLVTPSLVETASRLAWEHGLRGYDAVHLASAVVWQGTLDMQVTLATYDRELWLAGQKAGLKIWPEGLY